MGASASMLEGIKATRLSIDTITSSFPSIYPLMKLFNAKNYADENGTISIEDFLSILSRKTDVFLAHDWSMDEKNYQRVAKVSSALKKKGITTWFDDDKLEEDIEHKISQGIDNCRIVLTFITNSYISKTAKHSISDHCFLSFKYADRRKKVQLPVVIEKEMRDTGKWEGLVGMVLGGSTFVDLSEEANFDSKMDELVNNVLSLLGGPPLKKMIENINWAEMILAPSRGVPETVSSSKLFSNWLSFFDEIKIPPPIAERFSKLLLDAEVGTKIKRISLDKIFVAYPTVSLLLGLFNSKKFVDEHGTMAVEDFLTVISQKTDVFLAYDWSVHEVNHQRVAKVNAALQKKGITTWFDDDKLEEDIEHKISKGIDNCRIVLTFITNRYIKKTAKQSLTDHCFLGFKYADRRKKIQLPVVIEKEMRDTGKWEGQVGMVLGDLPYIDLSEEGNFDAKVDELVNKVISLLGGPPLMKLMDKINWAELVISSAVSTATTTVSTKMLADWMAFFNEVRIVPHIAERYARVLLDAGVGTTDRLKKKLEKNKQYLQEINFDEDDADEIVKALMPSSQPPIAKAAPAAVVLLSGHRGAINCLIELQDGRICSASSDRTVRVWSVRGGADSCDRVWASHTQPVITVCQMKNGLICSAGQDKIINIWSLTGSGNEPYASLKGHKDSIFSLLALRDGRLLSFSADNSCRVWNVKERKCDKIYDTGHSDVVQHAIMLSDGRTICTASSDRTIRIMSGGGGGGGGGSHSRSGDVLYGHTDDVLHLNQLSDGRIASCSLDSTVRIWNLKTGVCEQILEGHERNTLWSVQLRRSGQLVSCSKDRTIRFWNLSTGHAEKVLTGHEDCIRCLLLLSDDRIVSGSADETIRIWG